MRGNLLRCDFCIGKVSSLPLRSGYGETIRGTWAITRMRAKNAHKQATTPAGRSAQKGDFGSRGRSRCRAICFSTSSTAWASGQHWMVNPYRMTFIRGQQCVTERGLSLSPVHRRWTEVMPHVLVRSAERPLSSAATMPGEHRSQQASARSIRTLSPKTHSRIRIDQDFLGVFVPTR